MPRITVKHRHGQSFDIRVRGCALISDEPVTLGGDDEGPTPTELMVAGLAACAADEVVKHLTAVGARLEGTEVAADFTWDTAGNRIGTVRLAVSLPDGVDDSMRGELLRAMLTCPARRMLTEPPRVDYTLVTVDRPSMAGVGAGGWPDEPPPDVDSQP
jgi:putative redox protein